MKLIDRGVPSAPVQHVEEEAWGCGHCLHNLFTGTAVSTWECAHKSPWSQTHPQIEPTVRGHWCSLHVQRLGWDFCSCTKKTRDFRDHPNVACPRMATLHITNKQHKVQVGSLNPAFSLALMPGSSHLCPVAVHNPEALAVLSQFFQSSTAARTVPRVG